MNSGRNRTWSRSEPRLRGLGDGDVGGHPVQRVQHCGLRVLHAVRGGHYGDHQADPQCRPSEMKIAWRMRRRSSRRRYRKNMHLLTLVRPAGRAGRDRTSAAAEPGRPPVPAAEQHGRRRHQQRPDARTCPAGRPSARPEPDRPKLAAHDPAAGHGEHAERAGQDQAGRGDRGPVLPIARITASRTGRWWDSSRIRVMIRML